MIIGALILAGIAAAFFASDVAWELITGLALFGFIAGCAMLDVGSALFSLAVLVGCMWRWATI